MEAAAAAERHLTDFGLRPKIVRLKPLPWS